MAAASTAAAPKAAGPAGHWTINNQGKWVVIHAVGPGKWAQGPKPGHPAPSFDYLNPLTPDQVRKQATASVKGAYGPAYTDLNNQAKQEQAILAKQQADNHFYQSWLDSKGKALLANQAQVDQSTQALESKLTGNQLSEFNGQSNALVDQANLRAGNVSANAQSTPLTGELAANQQAQEQEVGGQAQRTLQVEGTESNATGAAIMNTGATLQAGATREKAAFDTAMTKIAQARQVLGSKETGDILKEVARLQGVQTNIMLNNRSYKTAVAKLGIEAANVQSEITNRNATLNLAKARLSAQLSQNQIKAMESDRNYQLDVSKYNGSVARDLYLRDHGLGPYRPSKGASGKPPLSQVSQNTIYSRINRTTGEINGLVGRGMPPKVAYAALLNGRYTDSNGKSHSIARESDQSLLNAAYNARSGGPGLDTGDVAFLQSLGLTGISSRLPVTNWDQHGNPNNPH